MSTRRHNPAKALENMSTVDKIDVYNNVVGAIDIRQTAL